MTDTTDNTPFAEFMDDYYAESDEHLSLIRGNLIALETALQKGDRDHATIENDLLRSFHTIKGLSAMVDLKPAEILAHHTETHLKRLSQDQMPLTQAGLGALVQATRLMESIISARRKADPLPDIAASVRNLESQFNGEPTTERKPETTLEPFSEIPEEKPAKTAVPSETVDQPIWQFTFVPKKELSLKGIDINHIRLRLEKIGAILQATPVSSADGKVFFQFKVATDRDAKTFEPWSGDGLSWKRYKTPGPEKTLSEPPPPKEPGGTAASEQDSEDPETMLSATPTNMVRVDLNRLDNLMKQLGDLVISRSRLENRITRMEKTLPPADYDMLQETHMAMERQIRDLREGVMHLRLVPMGDTFTRMQFVVKDLARRSGKKVHLEIMGKETEIDKFLVERMMDPLLHMVRNALTHGLESEAERENLGKPPEGKITLRASTEGDAVIVEVGDDGRGIDAEAVADRARELGLLEKGEPLDTAKLLQIISLPAFSTQAKADMGSGRGIGMSVAAGAIRDLGGVMTLNTNPGEGSNFRIRLPLTLAIVDAFIVEVGNNTFAVPQPSIREVVDFQDESVTRMENNELLSYRGGVLPLLRLSKLFGIEQNHSRVALVIGEGTQAAGIAVDRVMSKREIVLRTLDDPMVMTPGIAGATELGDGRVVMILEPRKLVENAGDHFKRR